MKRFGLALLGCALGLVFTGIAAAAPVIPGLAGKHPLSEGEVGHLLMGELRCAACHTAKELPTVPERAAPDLTDVGGRVTPDFLRRFLASPDSAHHGSTMPDLLAGEPAEARAEIAEALTHFLIAQSPNRYAATAVDGKDAAAGKVLFHSVGCVTCHAPRDETGKEMPRDGAVVLGHVPSKYSPASLAAFLFQPTRARPSGRMPDMKLTPAESEAVAGYLRGPATPKATPLEPQEKLVALGKAHFQRLNCAACHKLGDIPAAKPAVAFTTADVTRGCLSQTPGKSPRFSLSESQVKAIRAALATKGAAASEKSKLGLTLTTFNCVGCHTRDDFGGVSEDVEAFFTSSEKELGEDARIPPPLTLVGAKLQSVTMKKVLFDGDGVRPYMTTRMPQFGEPNLRHLPDLFARLDRVKPVAFDLPKPEGRTAAEREREKQMRAAGRELIGDKGLGCVACHTFNGKAAGKTGIDLLTTTQRLQPDWFYRFVIDPNAYRPRIVMPTSWPKGEAMHKKILNGDTRGQIEAMWYYLTLGTSAPDPSGIQRVDTILNATDAARTYRGRSSVAGYRGIAVGFPEKLNYAFNAETGTLTAVWRGDFIRVNRSGQGSGNFTPAGKVVPLPQDVSFHALADETAAWPLRPVTTKDAPENPDPLYPKNLGYQFQGYHTDDASVPTFMYRSGKIGIEDRSAAGMAGTNPVLTRTLAFDAPEARTLWFRAAAGAVEAESKTRFKVGGLRLTVPPVPTVLRPTAADPKTLELLLKFDIPKGQSTRTLQYELLP